MKKRGYQQLVVLGLGAVVVVVVALLMWAGSESDRRRPSKDHEAWILMRSRVGPVERDALVSYLSATLKPPVDASGCGFESVRSVPMTESGVANQCVVPETQKLGQRFRQKNYFASVYPTKVRVGE